MQPKPPISPEVFRADVLPILVELWSRQCFCRSPGFLKLLSFDFHDYGHVPAELIDSELIWSAIVGKHFMPVADWSEVHGEQHRHFRCPQCGAMWLTRSEQYSINMWPITAKPTQSGEIAATGLYLLGMRYFEGFAAAAVSDFRLAESIDEYVASVSGTAYPAGGAQRGSASKL